MKNLISVVIPIFNRGPAIKETVESVLRQNYDNLEIILVDDGSTDGTLNLLESLYKENERLRIFPIANGGVANARNFGLEKARGEFIAFLDHDDLWSPDKLRLQLEQLHNRPEVGVVTCFWQLFSEENPTWANREDVEDSIGSQPTGHVTPRLIRHNFIISMSVPLTRTQLLRDIKGFDPQTVPSDDWDLWLRLSTICEFACVNKILVAYRQHPHQQSSDIYKMARANRRVILKQRWKLLRYPRALWIGLSEVYFCRTVSPYYYNAQVALFEGNWKMVAHFIVVCCVKNPLTLLTPQWLYLLLRLMRRDSSPF